MNTDKLFHNQDEVMENIMLFSPMPVLQAIQDSYVESVLADMHAEDAEIFEESVPVRKSGKSCKSRRAKRRVQNARHKQSDRLHGKRHGDKYLDSLPRKKYLEADNYDHPTFRVEKGKLRPIHDVRRERETARVRDAFDVSPVERLTASILAHMSNHVFMWDEQVVWDLTEALCEEYRQVFPDDSYICVYGNHVNLYMQYMDKDGILWDERCYTLR